MTVAQAKGLEFDDVFLWDFFNGSPAEWRPLYNYVAHLAEVEETQGARKLPAGTPLVDVSFTAYSLCSSNSPTAVIRSCWGLFLHRLFA